MGVNEVICMLCPAVHGTFDNATVCRIIWKDWYHLGSNGFVGATEPAWQQYRRSGSKKYLDEVAKKFSSHCTMTTRTHPSFGTEINAIDALEHTRIG